MLVKAAVRVRRGLAAGAVACLWSSATLAAGPTKDQCVDANEDAQDLRRAGALLEARTRLEVCVAPQCPGPVRDDCVAWLHAVDEAIRTTVVDAKVDPGVHPVAHESDDPGTRSVTVPPASPAPGGERRLQRPLGLGVGALGLAGIALGGILAALAKSTDAHALSDECGGDPGACSPTGVRDGERAHAQARASTIALVGGGVFLGAGALIYFTAPGGHHVALGVTGGAGRASLTLGGAL
jgi:hypothetical protein